MEEEKTKILETNLDISNLITQYIGFKILVKMWKKDKNYL